MVQGPRNRTHFVWKSPTVRHMLRLLEKHPWISAIQNLDWRLECANAIH